MKASKRRLALHACGNSILRELAHLNGHDEGRLGIYFTPAEWRQVARACLLMTDKKAEATEWYVAVDPDGKIRDEPQKSIQEAKDVMRAAAEVDDELTCGDINRWEYGKMPMKEVEKRGYRIKKAALVLL